MGQFSEYLKMALYNIRSNKGRSFLTMLGIIIGIASVITILAIGSGLKADVMSSSETKSISIQTDEEEVTNTQIISYEDILALHDDLDKDSVGVVGSNGMQGSITTRKGKFEAYMTFTTPDENNNPLQKSLILGEYFDENDIRAAEQVAVINKESALYLFGTCDVIGMDIEVVMENQTQTVTIIGVRDYDEEMMESDAEAMKMLGLPPSISMEVPYTAMAAWGVPVPEFSQVTVYLESGANPNVVAKSAIRVLNNRHINEGSNLFKKQQGMDLSSAMGGMLDAVTTFIAFVAGISLLVGGIGVMNIMLVSVTERTREIGIRKALGAKTDSIVIQFLCESALISGTGGVIGILIGAGLSGLISYMKIGGMSARLSPLAIVLTTCFSCGVGIIFGIYPAKKAAKMSPIEALRQL
ncbi:MAG: ABC transporter permease [Lachnospiraceae bacterium]